MPPIGQNACSGPCNREGYLPPTPMFGGVGSTEFGSTEFGSIRCPRVGQESKDPQT